MDPVETFITYTQEEDDLKDRKYKFMGRLVEFIPKEDKCICLRSVRLNPFNEL